MADDMNQDVNVETQNAEPEVIETVTVERQSAPSAIQEPVSLEEQEKLKKLGKKKISKAELKRQSVLLILGAIFFVYGIVFYYLPLAGWFMAFQHFTMKNEFFDSFFHSRFVGLGKFSFLFRFDLLKEAFDQTGNVFDALAQWVDGAMFIRTLRNTLGMGVLNLVTSFVAAILFAILLNEVKNKMGKKLVQTISYLPHFLSWIIVTGILRETLSSTGIVNEMLRTLHIVEDSYNFFLEPALFWPIVAISNVWKETGWNAIIYLAAITAIDPCLYESAAIDGAGRFQKMRYITLPSLRPTIIILLIMNMGNVLNAGFELQYLLGNDVVRSVSRTIDIYVLDWALDGRNMDYSLGTAAGIFKTVVSLTLIVMANYVAKKKGDERLF